MTSICAQSQVSSAICTCVGDVRACLWQVATRSAAVLSSAKLLPRDDCAAERRAPRSRMVTFLTLLLGLVIGEHQIDLAVDDRVASVEVLLDKTLVGVVRSPPWSITCDFGKTLAPHLLEAVGRDREGRELDRAVQRVNLPREPAEVNWSCAVASAGIARSRSCGKPRALASPRSSPSTSTGSHYWSPTAARRCRLTTRRQSTSSRLKSCSPASSALPQSSPSGASSARR